MKFSTKSRYALRLMLDLAAAGAEGAGGADGFVSLKDVSGRQGISVKYLEQIVPQLVRAGLVKSSRGARGGYRLAKDARACTPGDVVRAMEGAVAVIACLEGCPNPCERADSCPALPFWKGLNNAVADHLDSVTLAEMTGACDNPAGHAPKDRPRA